MFKTSFGMFVPCDYETYKKLKVIKAVINVSRIHKRRFEKWFAKAPHNRTKPEPQVCSVFWKKIITKKKIWIYHKETGKYDTPMVDYEYHEPIKDEKGRDLCQVFMNSYNIASTPKNTPEEVEQPDLDWSILDEIYDQCLEWREEFIMQRQLK